MSHICVTCWVYFICATSAMCGSTSYVRHLSCVGLLHMCDICHVWVYFICATSAMCGSTSYVWYLSLHGTHMKEMRHVGSTSYVWHDMWVWSRPHMSCHTYEVDPTCLISFICVTEAWSLSIVSGGGEVCNAYTSLLVNLWDPKHVLRYLYEYCLVD